jgi:hypothetical protein
MGTNFAALVNHNLNAHDIHTLPDLLNASWSTVEELSPIIEGYPGPDSSPDKWQWSEFGFSLERLLDHNTISVSCHEFYGCASERIFLLSPHVRWWSFLGEQAVRDRVRRVCRHTASVLGSNQVVYLPSGFLKPEGAISLMYEGKAVEDVIEWLLENCGPPLQGIESIYRGDLNSWDANGYYIESV